MEGKPHGDEPIEEGYLNSAVPVFLGVFLDFAHHIEERTGDDLYCLVDPYGLRHSDYSAVVEDPLCIDLVSTGEGEGAVVHIGQKPESIHPVPDYGRIHVLWKKKKHISWKEHLLICALYSHYAFMGNPQERKCQGLLMGYIHFLCQGYFISTHGL